MQLSKNDIKKFRGVCLMFILVSILITVFIGKELGFLMLALSLLFLFTPYKEGDEI